MARILVCEDSPSQAMNLRMILEEAGHEVVWAEDGQKGMEHLEGSVFDMVLSDVQMPHLGGFDLCRKIRAQPQMVSLPVILMTTLREMQDMRRAHDVGANMYLVKPFQPEDLLRRLDKFLTVGATPDGPAPGATGRVAAPVGVGALRDTLNRIVMLTEEGLSSATPEGMKSALENIKAAGHQAISLCGTPGSAPVAASSLGTCVLLEPNDTLRNVLMTNLEKQGWRVRAVSNAEAALAECRALGSVIEVVVAEAAAVPVDALFMLREGHVGLKVMCMVNGEDGDHLPSDVPVLKRPFTINTLLQRLKELHDM